MPVVIYCNSGYKNNQNSFKKELYGSYAILKNNQEIKYEFLNFLNKTKHEAEYLALETALKYLETTKIKVDKLIIKTNSQSIEGYLLNNWKTTNSNMVKYVTSVKEYLSKIDSWSIGKISIVEMAQILGH